MMTSRNMPFHPSSQLADGVVPEPSLYGLAVSGADGGISVKIGDVLAACYFLVAENRTRLCASAGRMRIPVTARVGRNSSSWPRRIKAANRFRW
jgi:hypothetical protein